MIKRSISSRILICLVVFLSLAGFVRKPQSLDAWSKPLDLSGGENSNVKSYGVMVCDKYQNLHFFWGDNSDEGAAIYYRNELMNKPKDILLIDEFTIASPSVVIDPDDVVHITWVTSQFNGIMYYNKAPLSMMSDSRAWQPTRVFATDVVNSVIDIDPFGNLHMVYGVSDPKGLNFDITHTESTDGGKTWSDPAVVYSRVSSVPITIYTSMDIDDRGRIHLGLTIRSQTYGDYSEVGYILSPDEGKTWRPYRAISTQSEASPNIALIGVYSFGNNEVHLTWHDPRRMHLWSYDGGDTFFGPDEIMPLGGAFGGFNELVKDAKGNIHAVVAVADGVYSVAWINEKWGKPEQIDDRWIDPHGQHIAICQGNRLNVIYYDRTGPTTEWFSQKIIDAPYLSRRLIPTPTPISMQTILPTASKATQTEDQPATLQTEVTNLNNPEKALSMQTIILAGAIPSLLIIGLILLLRRYAHR